VPRGGGTGAALDGRHLEDGPGVLHVALLGLQVRVAADRRGHLARRVQRAERVEERGGGDGARLRGVELPEVRGLE
jgi:hypothetical protein